MNKWRNLVFPFTLALILGSLTSWLGRISEVVIEEVALNPDEPQLMIQDIQAQRFDVSGSLKEKISAQKAWQLPDKKNIFFSFPILQLFNQQKQQFSVSSHLANYEINQKTVSFNDNVLFSKTADSERPAGEIKTEQLTVNTMTEIAQTNSPIEYRYGLSHGTAIGLTYNNKTGQLDLPAKVKALIYDPKHHP